MLAAAGNCAVLPAAPVTKPEPTDNVTWSDVVLGAVADLSRLSGGRRFEFSLEEICERVNTTYVGSHNADDQESLRNMVVLVLNMNRGPCRFENGASLRRSPLGMNVRSRRPNSPLTRCETGYYHLLQESARVEEPRTRSKDAVVPAPLRIATERPGTTPAASLVYAASPCTASTPRFPGPMATGAHGRQTPTLHDVLAAAAYVEAHSLASSGTKRIYGYAGEGDVPTGGPTATGAFSFDRDSKRRRSPPEMGEFRVHERSGTAALASPPRAGDAKEPKWRDLVYMTLKKLYGDYPNRHAFRLKDIADLTESFWDELMRGKPKPGNFRMSVAAVLSAYPEFTTGVGAGHQGWWSLDEAKCEPGKRAVVTSAAASPARPRGRPRGSGRSGQQLGDKSPAADAVSDERTSAAEPAEGNSEDEEEFFFRQGEYRHLRSDQAELGRAADSGRGRTPKPVRKNRRRNQRLTWKALLICVMRDLSFGAGALEARIWISMDEIVAGAQERWDEHGPRVSMSKYWRPTLRRTLVENPEFKCGSSGYGMDGMWALTEFLNGVPPPAAAVQAFDRPAEEVECSDGEETCVSDVETASLSPRSRQEEDAILGLASLCQHRPPLLSLTPPCGASWATVAVPSPHAHHTQYATEGSNSAEELSLPSCGDGGHDDGGERRPRDGSEDSA